MYHLQVLNQGHLKDLIAPDRWSNRAQGDQKTKINDLLKPNEGFNLNEAQVGGNRCCSHIHTGALLRRFRALLHPLTLRTSSPSSSLPVALSLVFTHAFPGVAVLPGFADGNVPFSSVFIGWGEHGKRSRASSASHSQYRSPPQNSALPQVTLSAMDMWGNGDVRKPGLDLLKPDFVGRTLNWSDKVFPWVRACRGIPPMISVTHTSSWTANLSYQVKCNTMSKNISSSVATAPNPLLID